MHDQGNPQVQLTMAIIRPEFANLKDAEPFSDGRPGMTFLFLKQWIVLKSLHVQPPISPTSTSQTGEKVNCLALIRCDHLAP